MELRILRGLKKGPYYEFNISGDEQHYTHWDDQSLFLADETFGAFAHCFEACTDVLAYFGPTRFKGVELLSLQTELESNLTRLRAISNPEAFLSATVRSNAGNNFVAELEREKYDWKAGWKAMVDSLIEINNAFLDTTNKCIQEDRALWVLGI